MKNESQAPEIICPICKGELRLTGKEPHPVRRGAYELHTFTCDACLFVTTRVIDKLAMLRPERFLPPPRSAP